MIDIIIILILAFMGGSAAVAYLWLKDGTEDIDTLDRVYISGPMTGIPDNNFPAFIEACKKLEGEGYKVFSPHRAPRCDTWAEYMRQDIQILCRCKFFYLLPGWRKSRGAMLENLIAQELSLICLNTEAERWN